MLAIPNSRRSRPPRPISRVLRSIRGVGHPVGPVSRRLKASDYYMNYYMRKPEVHVVGSVVPQLALPNEKTCAKEPGASASTSTSRLGATKAWVLDTNGFEDRASAVHRRPLTSASIQSQASVIRHCSLTSTAGRRLGCHLGCRSSIGVAHRSLAGAAQPVCLTVPKPRRSRPRRPVSRVLGSFRVFPPTIQAVSRVVTLWTTTRTNTERHGMPHTPFCLDQLPFWER